MVRTKQPASYWRNQQTKCQKQSTFNSNLWLLYSLNKNLTQKNHNGRTGKKQFVAVQKFGVTWAVDKNRFKITTDKSSLKPANNFLLENCVFNFGDMSFCQVIGIPMVSDPAAFMVNIFLYYYDNKWLLETFWESVSLYKRYVRYKNHLEFDKNYRDIYASELEAEKENISISEAWFLDLSIMAENSNWSSGTGSEVFKFARLTLIEIFYITC